MADISPITPVATGIQPVRPMSLAEMVQLAGGMQQYQQAQQVNPFLLQLKQQEAKTGQIALGVEEQKDKERRDMQKFFANPDNFQTNGRIDIDKINAAIPSIAPLTGADYIDKYTKLGEAQTKAISAKQNLTQDQRSLVASRFSVLGRAGVTDKNVYLNEMDLLKKENPENKDLANLIDAYKTTWSEIPSGSNLPDIAIKGAQTLLTPAQQQTQLAPSIQVTTGGQTITTYPSVGAKEPTAKVGVLRDMQSSAPPAGEPTADTSKAGAQVAPGMRLPYPVRRANQPYIKEPTEEKDQTAGADYRNNLVNAQMSLSQGRRNVEEVIQQANKIGEALVVPNFLAKFGFEKGGAPERMERAVRQFFGSEQYDMLAKDLANMAITNSKAMGTVGGTVAGLDMAAVANGTIKVTPDVLVKIARRVQADQTNLDMQANGAQRFAERFGDNNMKAYQQAWNANADSKIFEALNIERDTTDPVAQKKEFERLFSTDAAKKEALKKMKNLQTLSNTGSL